MYYRFLATLIIYDMIVKKSTTIFAFFALYLIMYNFTTVNEYFVSVQVHLYKYNEHLSAWDVHGKKAAGINPAASYYLE